MTFDRLAVAIRDVHEIASVQASKAVNLSLTLRNWLIGCYIAEYKLNGMDRAKYGDNLFNDLAKQLTSLNVSNCNKRQLYRYMRFYQVYPEIVRSLTAQFQRLVPEHITQDSEKVGTLSPLLYISAEKLIRNLSYSHLELIVSLDDDSLKRAFYEFECIRGNWSVRELKRQIGSLYYERSGLSRDNPLGLGTFSGINIFSRPDIRCFGQWWSVE